MCISLVLKKNITGIHGNSHLVILPLKVSNYPIFRDNVPLPTLSSRLQRQKQCFAEDLFGMIGFSVSFYLENSTASFNWWCLCQQLQYDQYLSHMIPSFPFLILLRKSPSFLFHLNFTVILSWVNYHVDLVKTTWEGKKESYNSGESEVQGDSPQSFIAGK